MLHDLLGFRGRISRAKAWLSLALVLGWMALFIRVQWLLEFVPQVDELDKLVVRRALAWVWVAIGFYSFVAVSIKRLHDRDKGALWFFILWGIPVLLPGIAFQLMWPWYPDMFSYVAPMKVKVVWGVIILVCTIGTVWFLVELLFLRGTTGANRFGSDPLTRRSAPRSRTTLKRWTGFLLAAIWALVIVGLVEVTVTRMHWHVPTVMTAGSLIWTFVFLWLIQLKYKLEFAEGIVSPLGLKDAQSGRCWRIKPIVPFAYYTTVFFSCVFLVRPVFHLVFKLGWGFFPSAVVTFAISVGSIALLDSVLRRRLIARPVFLSRRLRDLLFFEVKQGN